MKSGSGFRCIVADPPWNETGGGRVKRGADRHYPLMKARDIAEIPVGDYAAADSHLWLWVTNNFLREGLDVMAAWGFRYVTNLVWHKARNGRTQRGLGQYLRGSHELCLFGVRGRLPYARRADGKRAAVASVVVAERTQHSRKPNAAFEVFEAVSPGPRLELFARAARPGWVAWGNELGIDLSADGARVDSPHLMGKRGHESPPTGDRTVGGPCDGVVVSRGSRLAHNAGEEPGSM